MSSSLNTQYQPTKILGRGTEGSVYLVKHKDQEVALKTYYADDKIDGIPSIEPIVMECLKDHPYTINHIATLHNLTVNDEEYGVGILMDLAFCNVGQSFTCLEMTEEIMTVMFTDMLVGLQYLHSLSIVHRDVKEDNYLIFPGRHPSVKLCDFGHALKCSQNMSARNSGVAVEQYRPPEILIQGATTTKFDIWCLGSVFYWMMTGDTPFENKSIDTRIYDMLAIQENDKPQELISSLIDECGGGMVIDRRRVKKNYRESFIGKIRESTRVVEHRESVISMIMDMLVMLPSRRWSALKLLEVYFADDCPEVNNDKRIRCHDNYSNRNIVPIITKLIDGGIISIRAGFTILNCLWHCDVSLDELPLLTMISAKCDDGLVIPDRLSVYEQYYSKLLSDNELTPKSIEFEYDLIRRLSSYLLVNTPLDYMPAIENIELYRFLRWCEEAGNIDNKLPNRVYRDYAKSL